MSNYAKASGLKADAMSALLPIPLKRSLTTIIRDTVRAPMGVTDKPSLPISASDIFKFSTVSVLIP
jgi:hypothetical protein